MKEIAISIAFAFGFIGWLNSRTAITRADTADREHAALAMRLVEVESVLTLEQKAALDMVRVGK